MAESNTITVGSRVRYSQDYLESNRRIWGRTRLRLGTVVRIRAVPNGWAIGVQWDGTARPIEIWYGFLERAHDPMEKRN